MVAGTIGNAFESAVGVIAVFSAAALRQLYALRQTVGAVAVAGDVPLRVGMRNQVAAFVVTEAVAVAFGIGAAA